MTMGCASWAPRTHNGGLYEYPWRCKDSWRFRHFIAFDAFMSVFIIFRRNKCHTFNKDDLTFFVFFVTLSLLNSIVPSLAQLSNPKNHIHTNNEPEQHLPFSIATTHRSLYLPPLIRKPSLKPRRLHLPTRQIPITSPFPVKRLIT